MTPFSLHIKESPDDVSKYMKYMGSYKNVKWPRKIAVRYQKRAVARLLWDIPADLKPHSKNSLTFYKKDGTIIAVIPSVLKAPNHKTRCCMAEHHGIKNWHHYTMNNTNLGMKRFDWLWEIGWMRNLFCHYWYEVDLNTGKIIKTLSL
jgi:hypothetical protein